MIKPNLNWGRVVSIVQSSMQAYMACVCIIIILACFGYKKGPSQPVIAKEIRPWSQHRRMWLLFWFPSTNEDYANG